MAQNDDKVAVTGGDGSPCPRVCRGLGPKTNGPETHIKMAYVDQNFEWPKGLNPQPQESQLFGGGTVVRLVASVVAGCLHRFVKLPSDLDCPFIFIFSGTPND